MGEKNFEEFKQYVYRAEHSTGKEGNLIVIHVFCHRKQLTGYQTTNL